MPKSYMIKPEDAETYVPAKHIKCSTRKLLNAGNLGVKNLSMLRSEFEQGGYAEPHTHEVEQVYYILKGRARVTIEAETFDVGPHASIYFPPKAVHSIENTGDDELWLLAINAPAL